MQQPILFRQAEAQDVAACWQIVDEARNNMMAEGKQQWDEHYPTRAIIEQDIAAHKAYLLAEGDAILAYGVLDLQGEATYLQPTAHWLTHGKYGVIHRLAIALQARGRGLAKQFFAECEAFCRAQGIYSIKVDTHFDNHAMLHLLQAMGYQACGSVSYGPRGDRLAFEKTFWCRATCTQKSWGIAFAYLQ